MNPVDLIIVAVVLLGVLAEARRGLFLSLVDGSRILVGVILGLAGGSLVATAFRSPVAGIAGFLVLSLATVIAVDIVIRRRGWRPAWGRTVPARIAAGFLGLLLGLAICQVFVPVLGRSPGVGRAVVRSVLARPFLDRMPAMFHAADVLGVRLPQLRGGGISFEDESEGTAGVLSARVNYLQLDGAMCIECRSPADFRGYRRRGLAVSPLLVCPVCGRSSDGCQTFEGFHRMYRRCPHEVAAGDFGIDCGVWPNGRPVVPAGMCPVDGRSSD